MAYQVQILLRPIAFAAATVVLLVLFSAAIYFVLDAHDWFSMASRPFPVTSGFGTRRSLIIEELLERSARDVIQARYDSVSAAQASGAEVRAGAQGPLAPAPPPVLCCYYDPAWANETQRGDWAYDLREHFRDEHCSHAVFVGAEYRERAIELPGYAAAALEQFLLLRRRGLSLLASVFVVDASWAAQESGHFASTAAAWLRRHGFQGLELDVGRNAVSTGYDALVMALSKELRAHLPLLILSVNIYPAPSFMKHVNLKQIHDDADILVLNTQDLVNDDEVTAAHSALYGKHSWNSSLAAVYALTGSLSQLVPVVSFTSREFELEEPVPAPTSVSAGLSCQGPADVTPYHSVAGHRAFFEVCQIVDDPSWSNVWQADDYCYMQAKGKRFVVLEERESVTCKVKFAAAHRLLGVALKRMDADAFRSSPECGPALPLLNTVVREMHRLQPRPHGELHQWTHAERRLTVVRANGKMACLSHAH